jgi:hypothetical protein
MAGAADVVDGASMAEECPTTLTLPSPPVLSQPKCDSWYQCGKSKDPFFLFYVYDSWAIHANGASSACKIM